MNSKKNEKDKVNTITYQVHKDHSYYYITMHPLEDWDIITKEHAFAANLHRIAFENRINHAFFEVLNNLDKIIEEVNEFKIQGFKKEYSFGYEATNAEEKK